MIPDEDKLKVVLQTYLQTCYPAMLRQRYHLLLAKGGPEYPHLSEQPLLTHILNGIFGLARLVRFLITQKVSIPGLDEAGLRQALALYTLHEVHKLPNVERIGKSEFAIPLQRLQEEYEHLSLKTFADLDEHLIRMANLHKRSPHQGDLLLTAIEEAPLLNILVRSADAMASATSVEEVALSLQDWLKKLGPEFVPITGRFALYWHQLPDVRGVLTNIIHQAVARRLEIDYGFYPLFYFTTGLLYIAPRLSPTDLQSFNRETFINHTVTDVLQALVTSGDPRLMAKEGLRRKKYDFESYVYAFTDVPNLLDIVFEETLQAKPNPKDAEKELDDLANKRKELGQEWRKTAEFRFDISLQEPRVFLDHWSRARRYLLYVDAVVRALKLEEDRVEWFINHFPIPNNVADNLRTEGAIWSRGGIGKYILLIAYHFLKGPAFRDSPAETLPTDEVLKRLHDHTLAAVEKVDTHTGRQEVVTKLGFRPELTIYLNEQLALSWASEVKVENDALLDYTRRKRKGHGDRLCSLCNRSSPYVQPLRTGILDDEGRIFSNRVLPAKEAPGANRPWCPICHLEFVFRKLTGLGLPTGADYGNSRRLYIYILPTFSFTPEHTGLFSPWLSKFQQVTSLPMRDYGTVKGIPHRWLIHGEIDPEWLDEVQTVIEEQAQRIAESGGRTYVGERMVTGEVRGQPHYYLIVWEKLARDQEQDDARIATRTEAWAKGILASMLIATLSGCKIYISERPYLPVINPADLKATINLDSPPPSLRLFASNGISLYGLEQNSRSGLAKAMDLATALWVATSEIRAPNRPTKDKHISERLALVNTSPLAGATFYKEYSRLNEGNSPAEILTKGCQVLLELKGGELMDLVQQLAEKSLEIALPLRSTGRGKPRRYELIFRETVAAMRKAFDSIPELRKTALTNQLPSVQSISELKNLTAGTLLKALERRQEQRRGEILVQAWGKDLSRLVGELVDLVVDKVYLHRARGSFAQFLRLENTIADGIFYHTDRVLEKKWQIYNCEKAARQAGQA